MTKKVQISVQQMKNNTEILSDMNEKHGLVTQVLFKCPVLPGWRTATLYNPHRAGTDLLRQLKTRSANSGTRRSRRSPAPGGRLPPSPAERVPPAPPTRSLAPLPAGWHSQGSALLQPPPLFCHPLFLSARPGRTCLPPTPSRPLPGGGGWKGRRRSCRDLRWQRSRRWRGTSSRPPVTSGHHGGGSAQPGRPFTSRRGAWPPSAP